MKPSTHRVLGNQASPTHLLPMRAWKQVDLADAHFIERGSLKLGLVASYADLENGRADPQEGRVVIEANALFRGVPEHDRAMQRLGVVAGTIAASLFTWPSPPLYAFCMSEVGCVHDPSPEKPKAVFQVNAVNALARRVVERNSDRIIDYKARRVTYARRRFDALNERSIASEPFIKDEIFRVEQEIRIVFIPRQDSAISTLYTKPDPMVSGLLSRIK